MRLLLLLLPFLLLPTLASAQGPPTSPPPPPTPPTPPDTTPDASANDSLVPVVNNNTNATNATAPQTPLTVPPPLQAPVQPSNGDAKCPRQCTRREWRALSEQERQAFLAAVKRLQQTPAASDDVNADPNAPPPPLDDNPPTAPKGGGAKGNGAGGPKSGNNNSNPPPLSRLVRRQNPGGPSEYDRIVQHHIAVSKDTHGNDNFLPWHRAYLRDFELALQRIDPSICLPYWNWSLDSQAPEYSPLLAPEYFGGNGQGADNCVQDGAFAGWRPAYPQAHCLRREYAVDGSLGAYHSVESVNRAISTISSYGQFRVHVEGVLHPTPHNSFGGDMAQMSSPNDPIFWLHHGYVDYMFARWQRRNGYGANYAGADQPLPALTAYRGVDVADHRNLCYDYADVTDKDLGDNTVVPPPPRPSRDPSGPRPKDQLPENTRVVPLPPSDTDRYSSRDRSNLAIIRYADPVSREWCERNNLPYDEVRGYEDDYRKVVSSLNQVKGYVSPCALIKRPKLQARIVKARKVEQFYVDVPDYGRIEVGYKPDVAQADPYQVVENVQQRVYACAPDVERPPEEYRATVQKLIGPSAFSGAGDPLRINGMEDIKGAATPAASSLASAVYLGAAAVAAAIVANAVA